MTPEEAIYKTLVNYIKVHGKRIISISSVFNQKEISIEIRSLFRYYEPTPEYPKLENAISNCNPDTLLKKYSIKLAERNNQKVLIVDINLLKNIVKNN